MCQGLISCWSQRNSLSCPICCMCAKQSLSYSGWRIARSSGGSLHAKFSVCHFQAYLTINVAPLQSISSRGSTTGNGCGWMWCRLHDLPLPESEKWVCQSGSTLFRASRCQTEMLYLSVNVLHFASSGPYKWQMSEILRVVFIISGFVYK